MAAEAYLADRTAWWPGRGREESGTKGTTPLPPQAPPPALPVVPDTGLLTGLVSLSLSPGQSQASLSSPLRCGWPPVWVRWEWGVQPEPPHWGLCGQCPVGPDSYHP